LVRDGWPPYRDFGTRCIKHVSRILLRRRRTLIRDLLGSPHPTAALAPPLAVQ
jgi:hypothetical protein